MRPYGFGSQAKRKTLTSDAGQLLAQTCGVWFVPRTMDGPFWTHSLNPGLPRDLEVICLRCLEKDPRRRYGSAAALAEDLKHWLAGEPIAARAITRLERAAKWARRKPTLAAAYVLGLLAVVLGGLGGAAVWIWSAAETARSDALGQRERRTVPERRPTRRGTRRRMPGPRPNGSGKSSGGSITDGRSKWPTKSGATTIRLPHRCNLHR